MVRRLTFVVAFTAASLLLSEIGVRLVLPPPQRIVYVETGGAANSPESGQLYYTTETGRRLRADAHVLIENHALSGRRVDIRTNSLGYRNPEIGPKTERPRVLFLGDSITFGDFLPEEETFVRRVERLSIESGRPVETINAGVGAIGLVTELAILEETGLALAPDVVVLCFYLNDARPSRMQPTSRVPAWLSFSHLAYYVGAVTSRLAGGVERPRARFDDETAEAMRREITAALPPGRGDPRKREAAFNREIIARVEDWGSAWSRNAQRHMEATLRDLVALSTEHGFELRIVVFPVRLQVEASFTYDQPQRWLERLGEELEVPVLDLLPVLRRKYRSGGEELFYDHCHPTSQGNAVIARQIWRSLERSPSLASDLAVSDSLPEPPRLATAD